MRGIIASCRLLNDIGTKVLLWDNSPTPLPRNQLESVGNLLAAFNYRHTPENVVLKDIYNDTISSLARGGQDYLLLLDDDTDVTEEYFRTAHQSVMRHRDINLFIPQIYVNGTLKSPSNYYFGVGRNIKHVRTGPLAAHHKMAINSGMIISTKFLTRTGFRYLEGLKSYCTDNYFMLQYTQSNELLFVLKSKINHSLSFYDNPSVSGKIATFREFKRSLKLIHGNSLIVRAYLWAASLKNAVKYKTTDFLQV